MVNWTCHRFNSLFDFDIVVIISDWNYFDCYLIFFIIYIYYIIYINIKTIDNFFHIFIHNLNPHNIFLSNQKM